MRIIPITTRLPTRPTTTLQLNQTFTNKTKDNDRQQQQPTKKSNKNVMSNEDTKPFFQSEFVLIKCQENYSASPKLTIKKDNPQAIFPCTFISVNQYITNE